MKGRPHWKMLVSWHVSLKGSSWSCCLLLLSLILPQGEGHCYTAPFHHNCLFHYRLRNIETRYRLEPLRPQAETNLFPLGAFLGYFVTVMEKVTNSSALSLSGCIKNGTKYVVFSLHLLDA